MIQTSIHIYLNIILISRFEVGKNMAKTCDRCGKQIGFFTSCTHRDKSGKWKNYCFKCGDIVVGKTVEKNKTITTKEEIKNSKIRLEHPELLGIISALLCLIGSLLPWATVSTLFGSVSISAIGGDGTLTLFASIIALCLWYYGMHKKNRSIQSFAFLAPGGCNLAVALMDGANISNLVSTVGSEYILAQVGIGIYVVGIGAIGLLIAGFWIKKIPFSYTNAKKNLSRFCPGCGREIPFDANICPYCKKDFE